MNYDAARTIARTHIDKANPEKWRGDTFSDPPASFSTVRRSYRVNKLLDVDIFFEFISPVGWVHTCELCDHKSGELLEAISGPGISSEEDLARTIVQIVDLKHADYQCCEDSTLYNPGDTVDLGGIQFMILDDLGPWGDGGNGRSLLILAKEPQGTVTMSNSENYKDSPLRDAVVEWLNKRLLIRADVHNDWIRPRTIDLTTVNGRGSRTLLSVEAAPLTLDEFRKYAPLIPDIEKDSESYWLATYWNAEDSASMGAVLVVPKHGFYRSSNFRGAVRPALVVSSLAFAESKREDPAGEEEKVSLERFSTDELLAELRRRTERKEEE